MRYALTLSSALLAIFCFSSILCSLAEAQQAVVELQSTVKGNQEQPKVLYIVPWQPPQPGKVSYRPLQSLIGEVFEPVDREEFVRQIEYQQRLQQYTASEGTVNTAEQNAP